MGKVRELGACDGAICRLRDTDMPLDMSTIARLLCADHNTRFYCAHGWSDIERIAKMIMGKFPHATNPSQDGWRGSFSLRKHWYTFALRFKGVTIDFADINNITRDSDVDVSRETFGGADDLTTTWNIVRTIVEHRLDGTTIGAMALHDYIGGDIKRFIRNFPALPQDDYQRMRPGYFGAYIEARPGEYEGCSSWDVNSLYPWALCQRMPCGAPEWYDGPYEDDPDMPLHVDVLTFRADLKPGGLPTLTDILPAWDYEGCRPESTYGYVTMPLSDIDQELLQANYYVNVYEHVGGWKFRANRGYFESYVAEWFYVKQSATGVRRRMAKLMLNALVGKLGAAINRPTLMPELDADGNITFEVNGAPHHSLSYLPVALYVNAYGRKIITETIAANRSRVIYADTDGIIVAGADPPQGITVGDGLGEWKNDHNYQRLRILGVRKYCGIEVDGTQTMRLSGVHRSAPIPYDEFTAGARHRNDWGGEFVL